MPIRAADHSPARLIDAVGVARRFGARWVLRGGSLDVSRGESVGLLGANGSGKSTLLRILATLLRPTAGRAELCGYDVVKDADNVRRSIGLLSHAPGLYDDLSARENLRFALSMLERPNDSVAIDEVLARVGLEGVRDTRVRGFSAGMQRRLALARLILARPRVLLLDEPYANLDTDGVSVVNATIAETVNGGGAALVVLHEVAPALDVLNRMVTILDGRIGEPFITRAHAGAAEAVPR